MAEVGKTRRMRIGELAAELDLNPKTIRYYEEIGLLPAPQRTPAGYRLYDAADLERLRFIGKAKEIGLTLEEIGEILKLRGGGERPCQHVVALLDAKIAAVDEQIQALTDFRQELLTVREEAVQNVTTDAHVCWIIERHERSNRAPSLSDRARAAGNRPQRSS